MPKGCPDQGEPAIAESPSGRTLDREAVTVFSVVAAGDFISLPPEEDQQFMSQPTPNSTLTTKLNRRWFIKMLVMLIVCIGFGIYGIFDAFYVYPKRGREYVEDREHVYLERLSVPPGRFAEASVADPKSTYAALALRETELQEAESEFSKKLASVDKGEKMDAQVRLLPKAVEYARYDWLRAHSYAWTLSGDKTTIASPAERLKELTATLNSRDKAVPLSAYDMPLQYGYTVLGFGLALYVVFSIVRTKATKYQYEPNTKTLIVPGGARIAAADLTELDKRKWHKFYVTLITRDGKATELDLYRFDPLEEWVLEMEKAAGLAKPDEPVEPELAPESATESSKESPKESPVETPSKSPPFVAP